MKKAIKKIIILLMIILISSIVAIRGTETMTYEHNDGDYFNMPSGKDKIGVSTWGWQTPISGNTRTKEANTQYSILDYANVFCIESNVGFAGQENYAMSVHGPYTWSTNTATNKVEKGLIYLLAQYNTRGAMNYGYDPVQLALWEYLYAKRDSLSNNIKKMVYQGSYYSDDLNIKNTPHFNQYENTEEAKELYYDAINYSGSNDYTVKFYILTVSGGQKILVVENTPPVVEKVNVSLQKYIIQVNGRDVAINRENKGTNGYSNINYNKRIKNSVTVTGTNESYKYDKPVIIQSGDEVTYKVYVYNNGKTTAKNITVTDTLPSNIDTSKVYTKDIGKSFSIEKVTNGKITKNIENLSANNFIYFEVKVKFNEYNSGQIWNKAEITSTTPKNNTTYRTQDGDSIRMKSESIDVSLQKYILGTYTAKKDMSWLVSSPRGGSGAKGGPNINYEQDITSVSYGGTMTTTSEDADYKYKDPVQIDVGDSVVYRIYVYNNGENEAKTVTVTDTLPSYIDKVEFNNSTMTENLGKKYFKTWSNYSEGDRKVTFTFENIPSNAFTYIDLKIHFNEFSNKQLWNIAEITSTGEQDNTSKFRQEDGDSITMLKYEVSLEKYVSKTSIEDKISRT